MADGSALYYLDRLGIFSDPTRYQSPMVSDYGAHGEPHLLNWDIPSKDPRAEQIKAIIQREYAKMMAAESKTDLLSDA
jgi:hypothetical protein